MPPLEIGRLRDRVTVQTMVETADVYGQDVPAPVAGITCWARVRPPTGRETVNADQLKADLSHVVTMLYRPEIDVTQQLLWGARILRITYIKPDEMKQTMDLYCVEQAATNP